MILTPTDTSPRRLRLLAESGDDALLQVLDQVSEQHGLVDNTEDISVHDRPFVVIELTSAVLSEAIRLCPWIV
jgi:hypothetical protein